MTRRDGDIDRHDGVVDLTVMLSESLIRSVLTHAQREGVTVEEWLRRRAGAIAVWFDQDVWIDRAADDE